MIIHSHEYFLALRKELSGFSDYISKQKYGNDVVFLNDGLKKEMEFIEVALSSVHCGACIHRTGTTNQDGSVSEGAMCKLNGNFPKGFIANTYSCINWVWDDVPLA